MFVTTDAHVSGETGGRPGRLRPERLVDPSLPPGIRSRGVAGGDGRRDRSLDFRGLYWGQLDVHESQIIVLANPSPVRGISLKKRPFTRSGDARTRSGERDSPVMRLLIERIFPMLQWNSKYTALVMVALLVVISALLGNFTWDFTNFTW